MSKHLRPKTSILINAIAKRALSVQYESSEMLLKDDISGLHKVFLLFIYLGNKQSHKNKIK